MLIPRHYDQTSLPSAPLSLTTSVLVRLVFYLFLYLLPQFRISRFSFAGRHSEMYDKVMLYKWVVYLKGKLSRMSLLIYTRVCYVRAFSFVLTRNSI
jgi:hypothetical protein